MKEELFYNPKHGSRVLSADEIAAADAYCEGYKCFLNHSKTEREAVKTAVAAAAEKGFVPYEFGKKYAPGSKVYYNNRGKSVIFAVIGTQPFDKGVRIAAAHVDSPRLDLKPNPLYEDNDIALLKTHYYGGIKKYQWTAIPLALHGVVVKKDGTTAEVCIGEDEADPKFVISDLLPHLAQEQSKRTLSDGIRGEELNVIIGSRPFADCEESEAVKLHILKLLNEKYGIIESDFLSAELEVVPAFKACDIGLDRSLIGSYGHDDRVCSYPALTAILTVENPEYTVLTVLTDKEETGSDGNTGLNSSYLADFISDLSETNDVPGRICMKNSVCLSADVNAAFDPTFSDVLERRNAAYINKGICITKYTGSRGKSSTNDASAELMGRVRNMLDKNGVMWQIGELGRVDLGGGGTVAKYIASHNIDVVDAGVAMLSMHAPFEIVSKIDVYMTHRAFEVFFKD